MVERAGSYVLDGRSAEAMIGGVLRDLLFIDERDDADRDLVTTFHCYGKLGIVGAFDATFGTSCTYVSEVASIVAHAGVRLGYLAPTRRLSVEEWRMLAETVPERYEDVDVRRSGVIGDFGEPSVLVDKRVLCYLGPTEDDWVAFDCWEEMTSRYVTADEGTAAGFHVERPQDPLVRDIRMPAPSFGESLVMTAYGKTLRWGPGWWLSHPSARRPGSPPGIAEQLRQIAAADPSQSFGPRRP